MYFCKEFQSNVFNTITYIGGVQWAGMFFYLHAHSTKWTIFPNNSYIIVLKCQCIPCTMVWKKLNVYDLISLPSRIYQDYLYTDRLKDGKKNAFIERLNMYSSWIDLQKSIETQWWKSKSFPKSSKSDNAIGLMYSRKEQVQHYFKYIHTESSRNSIHIGRRV